MLTYKVGGVLVGKGGLDGQEQGVNICVGCHKCGIFQRGICHNGNKYSEDVDLQVLANEILMMVVKSKVSR